MEGKYVAEVQVELINTEKGWSPYISLDDVREALQEEDIARAKKLAKIFILSPVAA